jgi:hypothetical protein
MYKVCSIFSQVLKLFSRGDFERAVKEHKAERHARGFTSWGQFMARSSVSGHLERQRQAERKAPAGASWHLWR